jgi:uncharacterized protein (DUF983 family)
MPGLESFRRLASIEVMETAMLKKHLNRGLQLRCPACGLGKLYKSFFSMRSECAVCGLVFAREQGYFVGAIYLNVAATESLIFFTYLLFVLAHRAADEITYAVLFALALILPLVFNRHARSLWLSIDHLLEPPEASAARPN